MTNLITTRPGVMAARRGPRAGERFARTPMRRKRDRARGMPRPVVAAAALLFACALGAVAEYFLDRQYGSRRRNLLRDRARGAMRRRSREAARRAKYLEGRAEGVAHKAAHAVPGVGGHKEPPDDVTLAQKVESIAFRKAGVPKNHVSVNAEDGVIYVRGQLERDEQIDELIRAVHGIAGVKGVKNLLHTPTTGRGS